MRRFNRASFLKSFTRYSPPSMSNIKTVPRCETRVCVLLMAEALSLNGEWNLHSSEASSATYSPSLHKTSSKEA